MLPQEWIFWSLVGTTMAIFLILLQGLNGKCRSREPLQFTKFTAPIFPSPENYHEVIWPRTGGQIGENFLSGWPQYFKAY